MPQGGAGQSGAGTGAGGSAGSSAGTGGAGAPACNPRTGCPTCGVDCCPNPTNCAPSTATGLIGWASQGGGTTGGGNGSPMTVSSSSELSSALSGSTARVVQFSGSISISNLEIGSNKTLIGTSAMATINGGITLDGASNVILRNFRLNASSSGAGDDGLNIQDSDHVWIDHLEVYDAEDGNMDITSGSDYITVSWTKFRYSGTGDHNFSNLIASADDDTGSYRITFHHNWWADRVSERMPRVRFGDVHVFNNYYSSTGNDHCVRAAHQSNVRVENNYFDGVATPHELAEDNGNGVMSATGNVYCLSLQTSGTPQTRGTAFTPPYAYTPDPADCVKSLVTASAGPR